MPTKRRRKEKTSKIITKSMPNDEIDEEEEEEEEADEENADERSSINNTLAMVNAETKEALSVSQNKKWKFCFYIFHFSCFRFRRERMR